jgi:hypothetical protein
VDLHQSTAVCFLSLQHPLSQAVGGGLISGGFLLCSDETRDKVV